MSLLLNIIVTYIKENIIAKLQKLYSLPRNLKVGSKSPMLFLKKPLCRGDLSPTRKLFIERPEEAGHKDNEVKMFITMHITCIP